MSAIPSKLPTLTPISEEPKAAPPATQKSSKMALSLLQQWSLNGGKFKRNMPINPPIWKAEK